MARLRVFVSSVQKELEDERLIVQNLLNTDSFLAAHTEPVLYEYEPASAAKATEECIAVLDGSDAVVLIVGVQYGSRIGDVSITHAEYRRAKQKGLPILAFIKGDRGVKREEGTETLLKELDADGLKYKRFADVIALQTAVRAALVKLLKEKFHVSPTTDEDTVAHQTIEATSTFESQPLARLRWEDLDHGVARKMIASAEGRVEKDLSDHELLAAAMSRGLLWRKPGEPWHPQDGEGFGDGEKEHWRPDEHYATAAGILLLAKDPSVVFPQCRILADAYRSTERDGDPRDHEDIRAPMPVAVDRALAFVDRNTRHPMRIVGANRLRLDEYPVEALREAVVNALAHRQYEDAGRKIILEIYADRIEILSPGLPPAPLTLACLRRMKYRPCSRNPVVAQCLSTFHRIEERGSGFRRMHDQMLDHGLDPPVIGSDMGYFQLTFPGPAENIERIRVPERRLLVTPAIEAKLNARQRKLAVLLAQGEELTSRRCEKEFSVTRDTTTRDFKLLVELGIAKTAGKGRSTRYVSTQGA